MIKFVTTSTPAYITTSHYGGAGYISSNQSTGGAVGMTRYNTNSTNMEVWDGQSWISISSNTEVSLTQDVIELLEWARAERTRQLAYAAMAKKNVTIADAIERVKDAELQLRELAILCDDTGV